MSTIYDVIHKVQSLSKNQNYTILFTSDYNECEIFSFYPWEFDKSDACRMQFVCVFVPVGQCMRCEWPQDSRLVITQNVCCIVLYSRH